MLAKTSPSVNYHFARLPRLIQIVAPFSPRLSRYTYPYGPEFQALVDAKVAELTSERRKGDSKAQQFADRLVASNPNKTSGELLEMVAPERRAELQKLLRYVPPPPESERLRRKRERIRTPLVADLERHLAERAAKPRSRPTGPVNTGCGADNPHDPKEGGS